MEKIFVKYNLGIGKNHTITIDGKKNLKLINKSGGKWPKPDLAATNPNPHDKGTNKAMKKSYAFMETNFYYLLIFVYKNLVYF